MNRRNILKSIFGLPLLGLTPKEPVITLGKFVSPLRYHHGHGMIMEPIRGLSANKIIVDDCMKIAFNCKEAEKMLIDNDANLEYYI